MQHKGRKGNAGAKDRKLRGGQQKNGGKKWKERKIVALYAN